MLYVQHMALNTGMAPDVDHEKNCMVFYFYGSLSIEWNAAIIFFSESALNII